MRRVAKNRCYQWTAAGLMAFGLAVPGVSLANHDALIEGNQDYDGDGRVGAAEDADGVMGDPLGLVFGTISGCLGMMNQAINQNGACTIVTSGQFIETVVISNQVVLRGAQGVEATIQAFAVPMDPRLQEFAAKADPFGLQDDPGVIINSPANRSVVLENLTINNWTDGIRVMGNSNVTLRNVRLVNNITSGVSVSENARVTVVDSMITAQGFRINGMTGDFPATNAAPGIGITATGPSSVIVADTIISDNFGAATLVSAGARIQTAGGRNVIANNGRGDDLPPPTPRMMAPAAPPMMPPAAPTMPAPAPMMP
jgi:hypothetical protein